MDKIKGFFSSPSSALTDSAEDTNGADSAERGIIAEALDASTLSWSTRIQVRRQDKTTQRSTMQLLFLEKGTVLTQKIKTHVQHVQ